ncbi:unnamed protein product [Orchesella dallaii]|uniref:Golgin subfamily A conserved domain-containing protein n=1 Tax=Orchesella dallaii TaxID=48710 RepID=A0ABP1PYN6_9HEXA
MEEEREKKEKLAAARRKLNEYKLNRTGKTSTATADSAKPADVPNIYQNLNTQATTFTIFNPAAGDNDSVTTGTDFVQPSNESSVITSRSGEVFSQHGPQSAYTQMPAFSQHNIFGTSTPTDTVFSSPPSIVNAHQESPAVTLPSSLVFSNSGYTSNTPPLFQNSSQFGGISENQPNVLENICGITPLNLDAGVPTISEQQRPDTMGEPTMIAFEAPQLVNPAESESKNYHASAPPLDNLGAVEIENVEDTSVRSEDNFLPQREELTSEVESPMAMNIDPHDATNINSRQNETSQVFASSLFGPPRGNDLDTVFSFCGTQAPTTSTETATTLVTGSTNPLVSPYQEQSLFEEIQSQVSFEAKAELKDNMIDDTPQSQNNESESQRLIAEGDFIHDAEINAIREPQALEPVDNTWESPSKLLNEFSDSFGSEHEHLVSEVPCSTSSVQERLTDQAYDQMKSMQDALELQIEELRRENTYLLNRQTDLTLKIEDSERLAHEFKLERDRIKEESMTASQAMRARINSLCEENQRIVKNSTEVGVDLRAKLEEKTRQLEEMQKAVIIVSQSKMDFAGRLDHELERVKELQNLLAEKDEEIDLLRSTNNELEEKLKQEQQKDAVVQQLQDQARHYQVQCETLQKELNGLRRKLKNQDIDNQGGHSVSGVPLIATDEFQNHSDHHQHDVEHYDTNHDHSEETAIADSSKDVGGENSDPHNHSSECTHNDHHHHHDGDGGDHHEHHEDENMENVARRGPSNEEISEVSNVQFTELKKTLHRLEWENSTFRNELDLLAVDAKQKKSYEERCIALIDENERLKKEVEQLEHVIIQLQGENDTIGDYITLYQTQKLALKECAKEKDAQLEQLAQEREMLLRRLAELTALVKDLRDSKSESSSQCADDHINTLDAPLTTGGNKKQIEGKIRDLLTEISSSTLIENFHPCALCSGRLMTV